MPAPFSPVHIPLVSGVRQDIAAIAQDSPSQLTRAENVVFTKKGAITGRPGIRTRDAQVERGGAGTSLIANLATATATQVPAGIVSTGFPLSPNGSDTPLACWQGEGYFKRDTVWASTGPLWSLRQTKSAVLKTYDPFGVARANPAPIGQNLVAVKTVITGGSGIPFLNDAGEITSASLGALTTFTSDSNHCAAGNAMFYIDSGTGIVYMQVPGTPLPATSSVAVGTNGFTSVVAQQATSAVLAVDNFYYLAYKSSVAGDIRILRVDSSGTVTQTLIFSGLGGIQGVGLCHNGSGRLGLAWNDIGTTSLKTKVITITAGVMADAAIDKTLTGTPLNASALDLGSLVVGVTHLGQMSVLFTTSSADLYIGGRSFTTVAETPRTLLVANGLAAGREWDPLFGGVVVAGKTLIGVYNSIDQLNSSSQWIVLDATAIYSGLSTADRTVAAAGPYLGAARMTPSSVYATSTSVSFSIAEGVSFSGAERPVPVIRRAAIRRITLSLQGVQAAHVNGTTLLSGQLAHVFDGVTTRADHFAEEQPFIFGPGTFAAGPAPANLLPGSYTYQVTWEALNGRGQIIRSGASNQLTVVIGPGVGTFRITLVATKPQLWNNSSQLETTRTRLWATQRNPTSNSPLYFVSEQTSVVPSSGTPFTFIHTDESIGNEEQLYETTLTLSDMRAPGADRGIAVVNERVWVADQDRLYASKIIRPNIAPSWNTEGPNVIVLPSVLGTIQGLATVNTGLVVLCSRGAAVVTGPGVDDTGAGPGWNLQIIDGVPGMGSSSPRSVATIAAGAAFQAQDGDIWLANSAGQAAPMSRALRDSGMNTFVVDVLNLVSAPGTNSMLISHGLNGRLRVLDLENGEWGTWVFPTISPTNGLFLAPINGALWIQTATGVFSVDDGPTPAETITANVETGILRPSSPVAHGWGRLRSVSLNEIRTFPDTSMSVNVQVLADQNGRALMNKTMTVNPTDPDTIYNGSDGALEFRTSVQRCSYFRVLLQLTPANFNLEGLDLWVANTGERAPTSNRS